jgi:hypothetical protein
VLAAALRAHALPTADVCLSCEKPLHLSVLLLSSPYYKERQKFCADCAYLKTTCAICELPIARGLDLKDGRMLCPRDAKTAILSGDEAQTIFDDVKRDVMKMLAGSTVCPNRNINFSLADSQELRSLYRLRRFPQTHNSLLGLTRSSSVADRFEHKIYVVSGLTRGKFIGVCAHEYGHAWLEENSMKDRLLDADAIEGFCELLAWKIMSDRGEHFERDRLREDEYTHGQIDAFIQAESDYTFYRVMKWAIGGLDSKLSVTNTARLLVLAEAPLAQSAAFAWPPPQAVVRPAPDTLVLNGISGPAKRRLALINGTTLGVNETAKVRLAASNVVVRCLEIRGTSVLLEYPGTTNRAELSLR